MLGLVLSRPLNAQGFIKPDAPLDSASARARSSFLTMRDSLHTVSSAAARLQRDLRTATDAVLLSRVRAVRDGCTNSLRGVPASREGMLKSGPAGNAPLPRRTALERSFLELRSTLSTCSDAFGEMSARGKESQIRDHSMSLAIKTQTAIRDFESAADAFLRTLGIKVRPYGAGASPYAGGTQRN